MDQLHVFRGQTLLGRYELHATDLIIGRAGHIVLDSLNVSRIHALLNYAPSTGYTVTDLGSRNGVHVNGQELAQQTPHALKHSDVIEIADFALRCHFTGAGAVMRAPPLAAKEGLPDTVAFGQVSQFMRHAVAADEHPAIKAVSERMPPSMAPPPPPPPPKPPAPKPPAPAPAAAEVKPPVPPSPKPTPAAPAASPAAAAAVPAVAAKTPAAAPAAAAVAVAEAKATTPEAKAPGAADAKAAPAAAAAAKSPATAADPKPADAKAAPAPAAPPSAGDAKPADAKAAPAADAKAADAKAAPAAKTDAKADAKAAPAAAAKADAKPAAEPKAAAAPAAKREAVGADVKKSYDMYFRRLKRLARADAEPTKPDAKPINTDLTYFKRRHPWRRALRLGWLVAVLASVVWMGVVFARGRRIVFTSETVSKGHEIFGNECTKCHVQSFSFKAVPDSACLTCHDGLLTQGQFEELNSGRSSMWTSWATHSLSEARTPACSLCHVEHGGNPILSFAVSDLICTNCHKDLIAHISTAVLAAVPEGGVPASGSMLAPVTSSGLKIASFSHHDEFPVVARGMDPGTIKLNHAKHLGELEGYTKLLVCADCHQPDASRRYMKPISYDEHCKRCHPIQLYKDPSLPPEPVKHGPELIVLANSVRSMGVEASVQKGFEDYIKAHPDDLKGASGGGPKRPGGGQPKAPDLKPEEWVAKKMDRWRDPGVAGIVDDLLHKESKNGCSKCHTLEGPDDAQVVARVKITSRWLPSGLFHHEKHRVVACLTCHPKAQTSEKTPDVLIPGIESCRVCHGKNGASDSCTTCHLYHDRGSDRRDMNGRVPQSDLATGVVERKQ